MHAHTQSGHQPLFHLSKSGTPPIRPPLHPSGPGTHPVFDISAIFNATLSIFHPYGDFLHMHTHILVTTTWGCHPPPSTGHTSHHLLALVPPPVCPPTHQFRLGSMPSTNSVQTPSTPICPSIHPTQVHSHICQLHPDSDQICLGSSMPSIHLSACLPVWDLSPVCLLSPLGDFHIC